MVRKTIVHIASSILHKFCDGQHRMDGVTKETTHPIAVAATFREEDYEYQIVSLLHDILELTDLTRSDLLRFGIPEDLVEAIELLTRYKAYTYWEYIKRLSSNKIARRVKMADIVCNLAGTPTEGKIKQYHKCLHYLIRAESMES